MSRFARKHPANETLALVAMRLLERAEVEAASGHPRLLESVIEVLKPRRHDIIVSVRLPRGIRFRT